MKRNLSILSFLMAFFGSSALFADTYIGSSLTVDANWDQSGNPFIIQSTVLVPPGVTLHVGPGVQVVFQGPATLEIGGVLKVDGTASAPPLFNLTEGGLKSQLLINGGEANIANARITGGVFLVFDGTLKMQGTDVTKGSGLYLKGDAKAHLKNNKFYGNASGVILDGEEVEADLQLNTFVQNTYGLYIKGYRKLNFVNNSIHDNVSEVVNNTSTPVRLDGNFWGTMSPKMVKDKVKGPVNPGQMKDIKSILRSYLSSELPVITQKMSDDAEAEDAREFKRQTAAYKKFKEQQHKSEIIKMESQKVPTPVPNVTETPVESELLPPPTDEMVPPVDNTPQAASTPVETVVVPPSIEPPDVNIPGPVSTPQASAATPSAPASPDAFQSMVATVSVASVTPTATESAAIPTPTAMVQTTPADSSSISEPPMPSSSKSADTAPPDSSLFVPMPPGESSATSPDKAASTTSTSVPTSVPTSMPAAVITPTASKPGASSVPDTSSDAPPLPPTTSAPAPAASTTSKSAVPSASSDAPPLPLDTSIPAASTPTSSSVPPPNSDLDSLAPPPLN